MTENRMELFIETLTGTAFELSCSPLETIVSIKAKIQFSEGIPVSQQHLIWKSEELHDDMCLQDYSITDGATLKLVLGMRGGPINTRQVSDTKKLKDIAEYVERTSEAGSSGGRPLTVLVFHDGDKVHMYTLMEKGDCAVSPLSGTISETSSIASIKNVEEVDEELARENEITREKIAQLQEQLRSLTLHKPKKVTSTAQSKHKSTSRKQSIEKSKSFHLPPLKRVDAIDSEPNQYSSEDAQFTKSNSFAHDSNETANHRYQAERNVSRLSQNTHAALNLISNSISTYILSSPDKSSLDLNSDSSFLPYIASAQALSTTVKGASKLSKQTPKVVAISMNRSGSRDSIIQYDLSMVKKTHKQLPFTSGQAQSTQKFTDLDVWLQNRPKTAPAFRHTTGDKLVRHNKGIRSKRRLKHAMKASLPAGIATSGKSGVLMQVFDSHSDISYDFRPSVGNNSKTNSSFIDKQGIESLVASSIKAFKENSPDTLQSYKDPNLISNVKNLKVSPKTNEISRPISGRKLPLIKTKKKSKRCTFCSKKTGLATSYTCRCGKNFCASHRYAETHHCTYDYKTEGRRMLQLSNPVVTASKLPKI